MTSMNPPRMPELRKTAATTAVRCRVAAGGGALAALLLLAAHVVVPVAWLQLIAIWIVGISLLCSGAAVLTWRMPVPGRRTMLAVTSAWALGTAASVWLAGWGLASAPPIWRLSIQAVALEIGTIVGALGFRALGRKRTAPRLARIGFSLTPVAVALVIFLARTGRLG